MKYSKQYNNSAHQYSQLFVQQNKLSIVAYFNQVNFALKNKKLLDLGCGDGFDLAFFDKKEAEVYGIDASEKMVKLAQEKLSNAEIKLAYFDNIPYGNNYFVIVVSKWAFQTSSEIEPIYKEVVRVLKPGGIFLFLVAHPLRQFIEKKKESKNYFKKELVQSRLFDGTIVVGFKDIQVEEIPRSRTFQELSQLKAWIHGFVGAINGVGELSKEMKEEFVEDMLAQYSEISGQPLTGPITSESKALAVKATKK